MGHVSLPLQLLATLSAWSGLKRLGNTAPTYVRFGSGVSFHVDQRLNQSLNIGCSRSKRLVIPSASPGGSILLANGDVDLTPSPEFPPLHDYFKNLRIFYLRSGVNELDLQIIHGYFLPYILRNAVNIEELILAVRTEVFQK